MQDEGWYYALNRYNNFLEKYENHKIIYMELGVGNNTPRIIKYPFWDMAFKNKNAIYICINCNETFCPTEIEKQSIYIQ